MMEIPVTHRKSHRSAQEVREGPSGHDVCAILWVYKRSSLGEETTEKPAYEKYGAQNIHNSFQEVLILFEAHPARQVWARGE